MSKSETSFTDIYGYITNAFDKGKMTDVEKSIKANGEAEEVFHMMMFDYQYDKKYIDSLIGEDLEKSDNFFQKNRQKSDNETLNDKDKLKQSVMESNNGINLPKNFEEIRKAAETLAPAIEQMISEGGRENHVDYAVHTIAEHCGKPVETAKEIVSDLIDGISEFDMQYENLKQSGTMDLSGLLKDRTEDEKKKILINSLIAMKALESESFSEEDIESLYDKYGEYDIDELVTELKGAISENDYFNNIVNELATGENLTPELIAEFKKIAENNTPENKKIQKFYTALALYLANFDEKIDLSVDDTVIEAKTLGACAAAAVEMAAATADLKAGNIDLPTWAKWVKYIFAGLLIVSFIVAVGILVSFTGIGLMLVLMAMFGQGVLSTIIAFAVAIPVIKILIDKTMEFGAWLMSKLEEPYGKAIEKMVAIVHYTGSFTKEKLEALRMKITKKDRSGKHDAAAASSEESKNETESRTSATQETNETEEEMKQTLTRIYGLR